MWIQPDEMIDRVTRAVMARLPVPATPRRLTVPIGVSVRHIHLCRAHVTTLFGEGHELRVFNELYQTGHYAAQEQLMVVGPRHAIERVRVLGPPRAYSQVELARTDAVAVGLDLPLATEGRDPESRAVTLVGPEGTVRLPGGSEGGAFIARRHVHLGVDDAAALGVAAGDLLDLEIGGPRPTTLHGVLVRVQAGWRPEVHLDTDEANACGVRTGQTATLIVPSGEGADHG
ncbi:hypothetical protein EYW49_13100 [Siculibacillus lacustris]|uniref:Phosphate propanoyltransferase n=1 Tax=Siculibacillus lacustris TaxID=1549641 RepID=A0A4Q9VME9_9HYPH|nr:PduL/EutD family phosphate acyltransferase [Siculibacillus lacustris]TBW36773.1 hypothetical protein EYW49_13100 [Siculibacillus lacustris]